MSCRVVFVHLTSAQLSSAPHHRSPCSGAREQCVAGFLAPHSRIRFIIPEQFSRKAAPVSSNSFQNAPSDVRAFRAAIIPSRYELHHTWQNTQSRVELTPSRSSQDHRIRIGLRDPTVHERKKHACTLASSVHCTHSP